MHGFVVYVLCLQQFNIELVEDIEILNIRKI
jgi:hypothetical protein